MTDDDHESYEMHKRHELSQDVKSLINNGLDFLDKARQELEDSKPKFSVVSFWTAVEILLKVPLVHEHWTLVCSKKNTPKKKDYLEGDFQSITYADTTALLRDVLEKPLIKETYDAFEKVRKHRNRVVHFYHPNFTEADMQTILEEQADAWFRLNELIRKDWRPIFGDDLYRKLAIDESRMLHTSHYYINAKFRYLEPKLQELRKGGSIITRCSTCDKEAGINTVFNEESDNKRYETDCLVCGYVTNLYLEITCPACCSRQRLEQDSDPDFTCAHCNETISRYELLEESNLSLKDQLIMGPPASCSDCGGYESICEFGGENLCTHCFALHSSVGTCDYCGGSSTSISDNSGLFGCEFCDGNPALWDDD
ncbi:hsdR [Pseudescherichia vulneris]|uniref:hsdR n=1 Tax=Pseudescherichia vulneris TaxID=566 RepID=UPI001EE0F0C7|nr:hsdR [Pseudescherichia vulneris]